MSSLKRDFASSVNVRFRADTAYFHSTFWRFVGSQRAEWPNAPTMTDMTGATSAGEYGEYGGYPK